MSATRATVHLTVDSAEAMQELGARLGRAARAGDVLALYGDLGAGKTCLAQGVAAGLGVAGPVTSPTFILIAEHPGQLPFYHVDLYRTDRLEEILALGLDELFDGDGVTVVEWAEKAESILPARAVRVRIRGAGDEPREIEVEGAPPGWDAARG